MVLVVLMELTVQLVPPGPEDGTDGATVTTGAVELTVQMVLMVRWHKRNLVLTVLTERNDGADGADGAAGPTVPPELTELMVLMVLDGTDWRCPDPSDLVVLTVLLDHKDPLELTEPLELMVLWCRWYHGC